MTCCASNGLWQHESQVGSMLHLVLVALRLVAACSGSHVAVSFVTCVTFVTCSLFAFHLFTKSASSSRHCHSVTATSIQLGIQQHTHCRSNCNLQEFSSDMNSRPVKRIEDVVRLRTAQFSEDSGPIAHPIRPESYIKMDNFYTVTVYEKGAEIIRVYHTLLGKEGFRCFSHTQREPGSHSSMPVFH